MKKLYIVFDQVPSVKDGGLITYYVRLVELLKDTYDIEIVSIFNCEQENKDIFNGLKVNNLSEYKINLRFFELFKYLKKLDLIRFFSVLFSICYYFVYIPISRLKIKKIIRAEKVIATSPSAAIFIDKETKFILEIHTKYEFFWGERSASKLQVQLMQNPTLVLFRSKVDCEKAKGNLKSVDYIYNFFDDSGLNKSYNEQINKNKFLFIGRLAEEKDLPRMINISKKLKERVTDFELDIYGDGPIKEELSEYIKAIGMSKEVTFKGFCSDKNVYRNYSALFLTSKFEGFPLVIIEAKANGIPTISTNWGEASYEVVNNGVDGYIAESDNDFVNKIIALQNEDSWRELSKNAYNDFKHNYSPNIAKAKWIEILSREI